MERVHAVEARLATAPRLERPRRSLLEEVPVRADGAVVLPRVVRGRAAARRDETARRLEPRTPVDRDVGWQGKTEQGEERGDDVDVLGDPGAAPSGLDCTTGDDPRDVLDAVGEREGGSEMRSISPAGRSPPRLVRAGRQPGNSTMKWGKDALL